MARKKSVITAEMIKEAKKENKEVFKDNAIAEALKPTVVNEVIGGDFVDATPEEFAEQDRKKAEALKELERKELLNKMSTELELKAQEGAFEDVLKANGWRLVRADQKGRYYIVKNTGDTLANWIFDNGILSANVDICIDTRKSRFAIRGKTLHVV